MITIVGSNKGGPGKSTTSVNLAVGLALHGKDVCLLDADPQASASKWDETRKEMGHTPQITVMQKTGNIAQLLQQLDIKFDHVIVDVAGRNSKEFLSAGVVAHNIIAPHLCSQFDLDTLDEISSQLESWKMVNPDLKLFMYQSRAATNPALRESERASFLDFLSDYPDLPALNAIGFERKIYRDVIPQGLSVLEADNKNAKSEIGLLIREVFGYE